MENFLRERTAAEHSVLEIHLAYWRRFYLDKCVWDSRLSAFEKNAAEKIMSISPSEGSANVVTTGSGIVRLRYRVSSSDEKWSIEAVDHECPICRFRKISISCKYCDGTGWQTWEAFRQSVNALRSESWEVSGVRGSMEIRPEAELAGGSLPDPPVEQFMLDHFRERTAAYGREKNIYGTFARRFYSPEFDWTRFLPSDQDSAIEEIVSVERLAEEVRVITRYFQPVGLRYHLSRAGKSWLIREVDSGCPLCHHRGRRADCRWCEGSYWEHTKRSES